MLVSVVIFAVDHAGTAPRLHAQIKWGEAVPEGIIVRARHIEGWNCELVQWQFCCMVDQKTGRGVTFEGRIEGICSTYLLKEAGA